MKAVGSIIRNIAKAARLLRGGQAEELGYQLWNKWKGVDFEFVSLEDLGLSPDRAHFHSSSGGPTLARVFRTVGVPPGSVALDLGSGKGGAALTLSGLGFAEVIGVELSADSCTSRGAMPRVSSDGTCASSSQMPPFLATTTASRTSTCTTRSRVR